MIVVTTDFGIKVETRGNGRVFGWFLLGMKVMATKVTEISLTSALKSDDWVKSTPGAVYDSVTTACHYVKDTIQTLGTVIVPGVDDRLLLFAVRLLWFTSHT